jgi:hypothetical protein
MAYYMYSAYGRAKSHRQPTKVIKALKVYHDEIGKIKLIN